MRQRNTAVLKSQQASSRVSQVLLDGRLNAGRGGAVDRACCLEGTSTLQRLGSKIDTILQYMCCLTWSGTCVANTRDVECGVLGKGLPQEYQAVRIIQRVRQRKKAKQKQNLSTAAAAAACLSAVV